MSIENTTQESHPSYGVIQLNRVLGLANFFMSKIQCNNYFVLRVKTACKYRNLHEDRVHDEDLLVEVRLSPNQMVELFTAMNQGVGVPCTIQYVKHEGQKPAPPYESEIETFRQETAEVEKDVRSALKEHQTLVESLKLTKTEKAKLRSSFWKLENAIIHHLPFLLSSVKESLEAGVTEAKTTIDGWITHLSNKLGLQALRASLPNPEVKLLEKPSPLKEGQP